MHLRKIVIGILGVLLFLGACTKTEEREVAINDNTSSIEEILFTSKLFAPEQKTQDTLLLATKVYNDAKDDLRGLYSVGPMEMTEISRRGDYYYNAESGMLYNVQMDTIRKQLGKDLALVGVYKDVVVVQNTSSEFHNEVTWEFTKIGDDTVLMLHANAVLSFENENGETYFTATHDTYLDDGFIWQVVELFRIPKDGQEIFAYGEVASLPSYEYALPPVFDFVESEQKKYQIADGIVYRILGEELVEHKNLHDDEKKTYLLSNFLNIDNKIYGVMYDGTETVLMKWNSNWDFMASRALPDYDFEDVYYKTHTYSHFNLTKTADDKILIGKLEANDAKDIATEVYILSVDALSGGFLFASKYELDGNYTTL